MTVERVNILGVGLSALNRELAVREIIEAAQQKRKGYVCVTGVHGVMESYDDPEVRRVHNGAMLCTPDGMPMVWLLRQAGHKAADRVYGPDLMLWLCEAAEKAGLRHFFYGGANGVAVELTEKLRQRFPGLKIVGTYEPPFRRLNPEEEKQLIETVRAAQPDLFWVGLSTPKQDKFMAEYIHKLDATVMLGVGAAFDIHAGRVQQAPYWIQRSGFEWFFRMCMEPRRLWKRYMYNNPRFIYHVLRQRLGLEKFPAP